MWRTSPSWSTTDSTNTIPVMDNKEELELLDASIEKKCKVGIRIACEEEPKFDFYTSRLGIRYNDIVDFYKAQDQEQQEVPAQDAPLLHQHRNQGHGLLLERAARSA